MKTKSGEIHAFDLFRRMQNGQDKSKPRQHFRWQLAAVIAFEKSLQSFVAEGFYHLLLS